MVCLTGYYYGLGTGKSLTAKAIASDWQLPLLKLDVGKLFGGIVGESESRLRQMISVAETISLY
jgi:SpoVK/Ycf46/Vps4 family AAA+-type ATPase